MSEIQPAPRAEHPSLTGYLAVTLTDTERARIGLLSFNQWAFTLASLAEMVRIKARR